jgi:hypothetical protein
MSVQRLISYLGQCQRRLSELRTAPDDLPLQCTLLRMEAAGGTVLYDLPFDRILGKRPRWQWVPAGVGYSPYAVAFSPMTDTEVDTRCVEAAVRRVERVTNEAQRLMTELPDGVQERLALPAQENNWWRTVFHLAWHFPRQPFLRATRCRLLTTDGSGFGVSDETFVQLFGTGNRKDLLPGLIYSQLEHDINTCSESSIRVVLESLQSLPAQMPATSGARRGLSAEEQATFRALRSEFAQGILLPSGVECKLMKLASSFPTPPAVEWAALTCGDCHEGFFTLSRLNALHELCQVRGPATEHFCGLAERAGRALPADVFPDRPVLFFRPLYDEAGKPVVRAGIPVGHDGPRPVMDRAPVERWLAFVFATLVKGGHDAVRVQWGPDPGPCSYAVATLKVDVYAASAMVIELTGLAGHPGDHACATAAAPPLPGQAPPGPAPKCPECDIPFEGEPGYEACPRCHLCMDQGERPELPWVWGPAPTLGEIKVRYDQIAEWERTPPDRRDPKLPEILTEAFAHPAEVKLRDVARRLWPQWTVFNRATVQAVADRVRLLTGKNPPEVDGMTLDEVLAILEAADCPGRDVQATATAVKSPGSDRNVGAFVPGGEDSLSPGLLPFDLPAIFRCAVELGAAVNDPAGGIQRREAEVAGERLLRVLNPRQARFPEDYSWDEFTALREIGEPWTQGKEPRPGWTQELESADASPAARQALLTLGLGLADLRGEPQWHERGQSLLGAGTWHLWDGMAPAARNAVRHLLPETHRLWGWPGDPAGEPGPFAGPKATMSDQRVLSPGWQTGLWEGLADSFNREGQREHDARLSIANRLYLQFPTRAPEQTPPLLAGAYDAVAEALVRVCYLRLHILPGAGDGDPSTCPERTREFRLNLPDGAVTFEEAARRTVSDRDQAVAAYRPAEAALRAAVEAGGRCLFAVALRWIEEVARVCEWALASQLPWDQAASALRTVPPVGPSKLLEDMRRQVSRAAVQLPIRADSTRPGGNMPPRATDDGPPSVHAAPNEGQKPHADGVEGGCWLW